MPAGYEHTRLWQDTLAQRKGDQDSTARDRLRGAYLSFLAQAAVLAAEIPQDLREYTVHDATHLDA